MSAPTATAVSQVDIHDPRVDPPPEGWAAFRARCLPPVWDHELLRREAWLAKNPPLLAVVRQGSSVVGALSVMVCRSWRATDFGPLSRGRLRPRWAEVYLPLLSGYPAGVFDDRFTERRTAIRQFERALREYVGPGLLGVVYRAMDPELVPALDGRGRVTREIDPAAVLVNRYSHMIAEGRPELTAGRAMLPEKTALGFGTRSLFSVAVPRPVLGR